MLQTGHASPVFFVGYGSYQTFVEVVDLKIGDSKPASLGSLLLEFKHCYSGRHSSMRFSSRYKSLFVGTTKH